MPSLLTVNINITPLPSRSHGHFPYIYDNIHHNGFNRPYDSSFNHVAQHRIQTPPLLSSIASSPTLSSTSSDPAIAPPAPPPHIQTSRQLATNSPPPSSPGPVDLSTARSELPGHDPPRRASPPISPAVPAPPSEYYFELLATPPPLELPSASPSERHELPASPPSSTATTQSTASVAATTQSTGSASSTRPPAPRRRNWRKRIAGTSNTSGSGENFSSGRSHEQAPSAGDAEVPSISQTRMASKSSRRYRWSCGLSSIFGGGGR